MFFYVGNANLNKKNLGFFVNLKVFKTFDSFEL